jgi:hypothetical protein
MQWLSNCIFRDAVALQLHEDVSHDVADCRSGAPMSLIGRLSQELHCGSQPDVIVKQRRCRGLVQPADDK